MLDWDPVGYAARLSNTREWKSALATVSRKGLNPGKRRQLQNLSHRIPERNELLLLFQHQRGSEGLLTDHFVRPPRCHLHDGCHADTPASNGSILPVNGAVGGCRVGAHDGVDPGTNEPGPGRVVDDESSTPTVAPDGSIFFGAITFYNYEQGHLMHFDSNGNFLNAFNFGWDSTVAIFPHGETYSVVIKNNHCNVGSYCGSTGAGGSFNCGFTNGQPDRTGTNPSSPEAFFVTQLSPNLAIEWSFQNTNTQSCTRNPDGTLSCVSDHPHSFEWCVNAPVVDSNGVVYANMNAQGGTRTRAER